MSPLSQPESPVRPEGIDPGEFFDISNAESVMELIAWVHYLEQQIRFLTRHEESPGPVTKQKDALSRVCEILDGISQKEGMRILKTATMLLQD